MYVCRFIDPGKRVRMTIRVRISHLSINTTTTHNTHKQRDDRAAVHRGGARAAGPGP